MGQKNITGDLNVVGAIKHNGTEISYNPDIPVVNNATLTIKAGGTPKGTFTANSASDVEVDITAADLGLSSALKFIGAAQTTQPSVGKYIKTTIGGTTYYVPVTTTGTATQVSATKGDVIVIGSKEYVCTTAGTYGTNVFQEIGDEGSYALNTVTITGTGVLGGGGTLADNRIITHNEVLGTAETTAKVFKTKIDKYGHISEATAATASDVGAEAAFVDGSATIASVASDIVTLKAGVAQSGGAISNNSSADIALAKVAKTGSYTDLTDKPTIETYTEGTGIDITAGVISLDTDVAALKSDLAVGEVDVTLNGTATQTTEVLNNIVVGNKTYTINQGATYTAGNNIDITNNAISVDSGDATSGQLLAANGSGGATWVDAPSTGVTSLGGKTGAVTLGSNLAIDSNNVLSATDTTYESKTAASGGTAVSLVTTGEKYTWNNKQDALSTQTAYTLKGSATKVPQITTNTLGQVTGITEVTITQPTVNDATLTITQNGTSKGTFTSNASSNVTIALTDTTYESKTAVSEGTAESLVTTGEKYIWNNKQDALTTQTAYTSKGSATKVPQITTNTLGQVTGITEVDISAGSTYTEGTGIDITNDVISLDTSVAALKSDLAVGEVDVTINGTPTTATQTLTNIVVGSTTYTNPVASAALYIHKDVMLKTGTSSSTNRLMFTCAIPATGLTTVSSDVTVYVSDMKDWNPMEIYFYTAANSERFPCRFYQNTGTDYGFIYLDTTVTPPTYTKLACTSASTLLYDNTSVSGKSSVTLTPSSRLV